MHAKSINSIPVRQVYNCHLPQRFLFSIRSVLDDIETVRARGVGQLANDSPQLGEITEQDRSLEDLSYAFDEHYRQMQILYNEVAQTSFATMKQYLGFYNVLPIRWKLNVIYRANMPLRTVVYFHWMPVATWEEAGADVEFSEPATLPDDTLFGRLREELQRLGRPTNHISMFGGWRVLSSFKDFNSKMPRTESSPLSDACAQLKHDVEQLFSGMPRADREPSWEGSGMARL